MLTTRFNHRNLIKLGTSLTEIYNSSIRLSYFKKYCVCSYLMMIK